jgi:hypothetical protein
MDPVLMIGAWAGAVIATVGAGRLLVTAFTKAVRATVGDEFRKVWSELADQDEWFHAELREVRSGLDEVREQFRPNGGGSLRDSIDRLELMLREHVDRD